MNPTPLFWIIFLNYIERLEKKNKARESKERIEYSYYPADNSGTTVLEDVVNWIKSFWRGK